MEKSDFKKSQTPRTARGGVVSASERKDSWRTDSSPRMGSWHKDSWRKGSWLRRGLRRTGFSWRMDWPRKDFSLRRGFPRKGSWRSSRKGCRRRDFWRRGYRHRGWRRRGYLRRLRGVDEVRLVVAAPGLGGDVHPGSGLDGGCAYRFRSPVRQRGFHHVDAHVLAGGGAHAQIALAVAGDLADEHDGLAPRPGRAARTRVARIAATRIFRRLGAWVRATGVLRRLRARVSPTGVLGARIFRGAWVLCTGVFRARILRAGIFRTGIFCARVGPAGIFRRTRVFGRTRILGARIFCRTRVFSARVGPTGIFRRARVLGAWVRRLGRKGGPNRGDQKRGEQDKPRFSQHGSSSLGG